MVLTPDFRKDTVSEDGVYCYLTDYSVYGGSNIARASVVIAMTAFKVSEDLSEEAMVVSTYNPVSVTQFEITNTIDGWVKFYVSIIPKYTTTVTPLSTLNDVIYDTATAVYYIYINSTPTASTTILNPLFWSIIADPTKPILENIGTTNASANISYQIVNSVNTWQIEKCYVKIAVAHAKETCDCNCAEDTKSYKAYIAVDALLNAIKIDNIEQLYIEAERASQDALNQCDKCGNC